MAQWLRCWIPNPGVLSSRPLGGSKINSTFNPSKLLFFLIVHKYNNTRYNPTPQTYSNYEGIVTLQIILLHNTLTKRELEGCVHYNFAYLLFKSKREHSWNWGKFFISLQKLFSFSWKSSFRIIDIQVSWCHQMSKHQARNTFYWIILEVNTVC